MFARHTVAALNYCSYGYTHLVFFLCECASVFINTHTRFLSSFSPQGDVMELLHSAVPFSLCSFLTFSPTAVKTDTSSASSFFIITFIFFSSFFISDHRIVVCFALSHNEGVCGFLFFFFSCIILCLSHTHTPLSYNRPKEWMMHC